MPIDKAFYTRGMRLTGSAYPVEESRRATIKRGQFMTSPGGGVIIKRAQLPNDLQEFESAAAEADRLTTIGYEEIRTRLNRARGQLAQIEAGLKR